MSGAVEWIKDSVGICAGIDNLSESNLKQLFGESEKEYNLLNEAEKSQVRQIIKKQFLLDDQIYIFSFFINYMNIKDFREDLLDCLIQKDYNCCLGSSMEFQIEYVIKDCYKKRRQLHRDNILKYEETLGISYPYIPVNERNDKRVVIITGQLIGDLHAPSKAVIDYAYVLKKMGYEVKLFVCPCDYRITEDMWYGPMCMVSVEAFKNRQFVYEYKGESLDVYQINMTEDALEHYLKMLSIIYEFNPLFVYNIGTVNPIGDVANRFTTVVAKKCALGLPVSEADILVEIEGKAPCADHVYITENQTVIKAKSAAFCFSPNEHTYSREQLKLPEDKFIIAIVGNRLDIEVDDEFISFMERVLDKCGDVAFAVIGNVTVLKEGLDNSIIRDRIYYLGYCKELLSVYKCMDLFVNPKRDGGGYSALMALVSHLPVVTLPDCDVAYNAGEDFTVNSYDEMLQEIYRYYSDEDFYNAKKALTKSFEKRNSMDELEKCISEEITNITKVLKENYS